MILDTLAVTAVGTLFWHETRVAADRRGNADVQAAAPVIAGVAVAVAYLLAGEVVMPVETVGIVEVSVWERRTWTATRAVCFGAGSIVWLTVLQAALGAHGHITYRGRLLGPLAPDTEGES